MPFTQLSPVVEERPAELLEEVAVEILDPDLCGRFAARVLRA